MIQWDSRFTGVPKRFELEPDCGVVETNPDRARFYADA